MHILTDLSLFWILFFIFNYTLLQYYGKSLEALPGVAYPGFRDNRSTLNTKTGFLKKRRLLILFFLSGPKLG